MDQHLREARPADLGPATDTLGAAFADYPFTRHTVAADDHQGRVRRLQRMFLERIGLAQGRAWVVPDPGGEIGAVAVWTTPDTDLRVFAEIAPLAQEIAGDRAAASEAAERALQPLRPTHPVWFLATVGVRPDRQGRGLGRVVVEPGLRAADAAGVPCFLETSLASNVAFYRRLGFEVAGEVDIPCGGPRTWAMRRAVPNTPGWAIGAAPTR
ncbi:GNAT family N-acetyltransferase [Pseudonocardia sp. MH-G8]|uniref:GNAT family N-acetyltransferase n=1 Tax=Pseudonocardia sp. MH-G8 TaxID=1854588 RepID=UPI000BA0AC75|nr:GNAT family N-acetyltransferase [Pseudonocardia sp. MH-G8]OZM82694.1 N-acetyltransferase [Pseudonocardia sp. MH-G8]